jgi:translocation and assembly module TamA
VFGSSGIVRGVCRASLALLSALAAAALAADPAGLRFSTEIEAPSALAAALRENLDLVRWQDYDALTPELLDRLAGEARAQAAEILATRGYFSPQVTVGIEDREGARVVRIAVEPGEPTRVRSVRVEFTGPVLDDAEGAARMAAVRQAWPLVAGDAFTQQAWEAAKTLAVATLSASRYAAAGLASSRATIDPPAHAADLEVTLASGPALAFGELEISGLDKHPEATVRNLSPIRPGEPYSREKLETYQRRLIATNYFASVHVTADVDPAHPATLPVKVSVIEAPKRKIDVGLGYSTDTLFRVQLDYRDVNFLGLQHRLNSTLRYETKVQTLAADLVAPPDHGGWFNTYSAKLEATQIEGLETDAVAVGFVRKLADERNQPAWGAAYLFERQEPEGSPPDDTYALVGSVWYTWRRTDELISPRRGWNATVQLSAAPPGVSSRAFGRAIGKLAWFQPLARNFDAAIRAEAGAVLADTSSGIPQAMLFRTGGDTTVRGYAFESLGVKQGSAVVGGRYYGVASAETVYWAWENIGIAAFVDAGNAVDEPSDFRLAVGYGLGGRVRTPAGPLRLDVAYGQDTGEFRIHFSFGLTF